MLPERVGEFPITAEVKGVSGLKGAVALTRTTSPGATAVVLHPVRAAPLVRSVTVMDTPVSEGSSPRAREVTLWDAQGSPETVLATRAGKNWA